MNFRSIREFVVKIRLKRLHIIKIQYKLPTNTPKRYDDDDDDYDDDQHGLLDSASSLKQQSSASRYTRTHYPNSETLNLCLYMYSVMR